MRIFLITELTDEGHLDRNLSRHNDNLEQLVFEAASDNPLKQLLAVQSVRKLLSSDQSRPIDALIARGILPIMVRCLENYENPALQFEAAGVLTNISSGTSYQTQAVVMAGAALMFRQLLDSSLQVVCEQALWALCNIIDDGPDLRDYVINLGVVQPLLSLIKSNIHLSFLRSCSRFIAILCRLSDPPVSIQTIGEILPALNILLNHTDINILEDTTQALSEITFGGNDRVQMVIDSDVVPNLIPLLSHSEITVQTAALRSVGYLVTGTEEQSQMVLDCDSLSHFPALLTHPHENIRKEAVWILSNIIFWNQSHVQAVIDADLLPKIIRNLSQGDFQTPKEAARAVRNLTFSGNSDQVARLVKDGVMIPFCDLLSCKDPVVIHLVLEGINNILKMAGKQLRALMHMIEECRGLSEIEKLQDHVQVNIYKLAREIIEQYFSEQKTEDVNMPPQSFEGKIHFDPDAISKRIVSSE